MEPRSLSTPVTFAGRTPVMAMPYALLYHSAWLRLPGGTLEAAADDGAHCGEFACASGEGTDTLLYAFSVRFIGRNARSPKSGRLLGGATDTGLLRQHAGHDAKGIEGVGG